MTSLPTKKRLATWQRVLIVIACVLLALILLGFTVFGVLWLRGRQQLLEGNDVSIEPPKEVAITIEDGNIVLYNGVRYQYNPNMTAVLCMGTDKSAEKVQEGEFNGQADAIFLVAIDTNSGKTTVISISRDIMAEIEVYDESGRFRGIEVHQICLAHAYGDGVRAGCENMTKAVSRLLCDIPINTYFSIDWSSVPLLTQSVDGVTVPAYDKDWNPTGDTTTLTGKDTIQYLRGRRTDIVTANNGRMERHLAYLKAFAAKAVSQSKTNPTFPLKLFDTLNSHSVHNVDSSRITYLSTVFLSNGAQLSFRSVQGEVTRGEEYAEMRVDQEALFQLVLDTFFQEVE